SKLEELMFQESQRIGAEIMSAKIEGLPFQRFTAGKLRSVSPAELLQPIERPVATLITEVPSALPGGKKTIIQLVEGPADQALKVTRANVKELMHTHPVSGRAVFSLNIHEDVAGRLYATGDIPFMRQWAKDSPLTTMGVIGSSETRIAPAAA